MIRKTLKKQVYAYPVQISQVSGYGYLFYIMDLMESVYSGTIAEGLEKTREFIGRMAIEKENNAMVIEPPSFFDEVAGQHEPGTVITFIAVDFAEFRRKMGRQSIHKNVTIPAWMEYEAEMEGLNYSTVLQEAIKEKLGIIVEKEIR